MLSPWRSVYKPCFRFAKMAPGTTRQSKAAAKNQNEHEISEEDSSADDSEKEFSLSDKQMNAVSFLVKSAVSAAVAQMIPLTQQLTKPQHAPGEASSSASAQGSNGAYSSSHDRTLPEDQNPPGNAGTEEGEIRDEVLDDYEKSLIALLGDHKVTGPVISDKIGRVLERCLGSPLDEKIVKQKRDAYPRPDNIKNLKVPRTNPEVFTKASVDHQNLDRGLQLTQSFMVGGLVAAARQAEQLREIRTWVGGLEEEEKEKLPEPIRKLSTMYVELMDSIILNVKSMGDITNIRRRMFKNDLVEPFRSLMEDDKNPPSPDWLGGDDIHGAIRKARANATLTEDIARKNKWPKKSFYGKAKNSNRPYDKKKNHQHYDGDGKQGFRNNNNNNNQNRRKSDTYRPQNERRQDFYRRDSR